MATKIISKFFKQKTENGYKDIYYSTESNLVFMSDGDKESLTERLSGLNTYVKKEGDTMTGDLQIPSVTLSNDSGTAKAVVEYDETLGAIKFSFK